VTVKRSRTITLLLALLGSLAVLGPATAAAAPAQEEYVLDLPSAGEDERSADPGRQAEGDGRGPAGIAAAADPETVSGIAANGDGGGLTILLVILAGTALAGASIAIVKAAK